MAFGYPFSQSGGSSAQSLPQCRACRGLCRHEHTWPHGVGHAGARAAVALGARPSRTWSAATRPPRSRRPRHAPAWRPTARARARFLIWRCATAPPPATSPMPAAPRRARHDIARDEPFARPHEQFALSGLAQTAPSPRHLPTRQVASAGRRRPACAQLPLRAQCTGATRLRGLGAAAVAGPLTLRRPLLRAAWGVRGGARGAQRPPWHVFSARSSLEAMRPCGLAARLLRS